MNISVVHFDIYISIHKLESALYKVLETPNKYTFISLSKTQLHFVIEIVPGV